MEQVQYDINKLEEKLNLEFQLYDANEIDNKDLEIKLDSSNIQRVDANIRNYLSQSYGRERCQSMHSMTRRELLAAMVEHFTRQKKCYEDLLVEFKKTGDSI